MKTNCWEYKRCGREAGGAKVRELGVCPAYEDQANEGLNGGSRAGRYCWKVAGTFCGGKIQGTWAVKMGSCSQCDFFRAVRAEQGAEMRF